MIKFSKLTDYAVVVLTTLHNSDEFLLSASALSTRTLIPEPTVSKVLKLLVKAGLVQSMRGTNGGYKMNKSVENITISDIAIAIEGPVSLTACVDDNDEECSLANSCSVNGRWNTVNTAVKNALESVTLKDMIAPNMFLKASEVRNENTQRGKL